MLKHLFYSHLTKPDSGVYVRNLFLHQNFVTMATIEDSQVDQFITRRMMRYCREAGMNFFETAKAMRLNAHDRERLESDWIES